MFRSDDIHPVTDFVRNHKRHQEHLRTTGRPEVLTINGTPELVLQDVRAYEREVEGAQRVREENRDLRPRRTRLRLPGLGDPAQTRPDGAAVGPGSGLRSPGLRSPVLPEVDQWDSRA